MSTSNARDITRWWWVRHAPVPQLADRIYGSMDPDADVSDTQRFIRLAQSLPPNAVWVVSALQRTHQTARAIETAGYPLPELIVEPAFGEQNFGALHGVLHVEHETARVDPFRNIWPVPPDVTPSGGESFLDVIDRVSKAINRLTQVHRGRDVVCVAHGGSIRAAVAEALQLSPGSALSLSIKNLTLTRLNRYHDVMEGGPRWQVLGLNESLVPILRNSS